MTSKQIKDALMEAITNFAIAENEETYPGTEYYMGQIHAYLSVMDDYDRLMSPWENIWHKVLHSI